MATVRRVLGWRRRPQRIVDEATPLLAAYRERHPRGDTDLIERAYRTAAAAHDGQTRKSGEPYVHHPLAVATIVARQGLDDVTVGAALLHDAIEDTRIDLEDLERDFGSEVATIVDGVTKLDRLSFDTREDQQAASMRKMLVAVAKDLRVLVIKLADRLHNMRTLAALPEHKQERTAQETLDIYAPLAHRLGMQEVKVQLEDLALATLHPKRYSEISQMVQDRAPERDLYLTQIVAEVERLLAEVGITGDVDRWQLIEWQAPSNVYFDIGCARAGTGASDGDRGQGVSMWSTHLITPETETSSHYHFSFARDYALDDPDVTEILRNGARSAFLEDLAVLEAQQRAIAAANNPPPIDINIDNAPLQARRILSELIEAETGIIR